MECVICVSMRKKYNILLCGHIVCTYCHNRLKRMTFYKCPTCRINILSTIEMDDHTLQLLLQNTNTIDNNINSYIDMSSIVDETTEHERQYALLFTDKYLLQYKFTLLLYLHKWALVKADNYEFNSICSICKHFGLNKESIRENVSVDSERSLLCNLYYNTVPCNIYTIIDAAVISLLSIKHLKIESVSPKDIAYHYFHNNCITKGDTFDADLLQIIQHDFISSKNPYKELYTALISNKIKVVDKHICLCNKTKNEVNDIILNELKNNNGENIDVVATKANCISDGFLFSDGLITKFMDSDISYQHDKRFDILRTSTAKLRYYMDTLQSNKSIHNNQNINLKQLLPISLVEMENIDEQNISDTFLSFINIEDEAIEDIVEEQPNRSTRQNNTISVNRQAIVDENRVNPEKQLLLFSAFSTCEICLAEIKFINYQLMSTFDGDNKKNLFKGSNNSTIIDILLQTNQEKLKVYMARTFNLNAEDIAFDNDFAQKIMNQFANHLSKCFYAKQRLIRIKALFKSLDQLQNIDFTNHTFHKLFDGQDKLLCSRTFLCSFIEEKCPAFTGETYLATNSQILKLIQNVFMSHNIL